MSAMTYELREMTPTSWILQHNGVRIAVITVSGDGLTAIGRLERKAFKDIEDLARFIGSKVEIVQQVEDDQGDVLGDIDGYPVKHANIETVGGSELPLYRKGKVQHSAGYYGIKFKNGWVSSYCPKHTTLSDNEFIGPFRNRLEMLNSISQKKREISI
jgi:hypothetical protein